MPRDDDRPRTLRLFVAVELPDETKHELTRVIDRLKHAGTGDAARWVRPEGIHVTLKFLGPVAPDRVEGINTALRIALQDARAIELRPEGIGQFGGRRNIRVVWVGVGGDRPALESLAAFVERALVPLGFPTEQRAFNPHLTLARVRETASPTDRDSIFQALAAVSAFRAPAFSTFRVQHVSLMQSTLGPGGATYHAINTFELQ